MHYRARSYDPRTGRFIQKDPLRGSSIRATFVYVQNAPTRLTDPSGAQEQDPELSKMMADLYVHLPSGTADSSGFWLSRNAEELSGSLRKAGLSSSKGDYPLNRTLATLAVARWFSGLTEYHFFEGLGLKEMRRRMMETMMDQRVVVDLDPGMDPMYSGGWTQPDGTDRSSGKPRIRVQLQKSPIADDQVAFHEALHATFAYRDKDWYNRVDVSRQHRWTKSIQLILPRVMTNLKAFENLVEGKGGKKKDLQGAKALWRNMQRPFDEFFAPPREGSNRTEPWTEGDKTDVGGIFGLKTELFSQRKLREFYVGKGGDYDEATR